MVRGTARAATLRRSPWLCSAAFAAALALSSCGNGEQAANGKNGEAPLAWSGSPVVHSSSTGAHVLVGAVKNDSSGELKLTAAQVRVLDKRGRPIRSTAVFSSGFVRSIYPHNGVQPSAASDYPEVEQKRVGFLVVIGSGKSAPLTVSWREQRGSRKAARIDYGKGSLPVTG